MVYDAGITTTEETTIKMWLKEPVPAFGSNCRTVICIGFILPIGMQVCKVKPIFGDAYTLARFLRFEITCDEFQHEVALVLDDMDHEGFYNPSDPYKPFVMLQIEKIPTDNQTEHMNIED